MCVLFAACTEEQGTGIEYFYAPPAGTVVAADSTRIAEDELNELYYSVRLTANDSSQLGYYDMDAVYGYNEAHSVIVFPKLDKTIHPAIRPDSLPYSFIIGFYYEGEKKFNDYARVSAQKKGALQSQIELRYVKAYFMDSTAD